MPFEKNHRVKLMRGFGMAITTNDSQIILKNGKHFYEKDHEIESYYPSKFPYERLVISGKGILSTDAIKSLSENNVNVILTDSSGTPVSSLNFPMVSGIGSRNRMNQYDTFRDEAKIMIEYNPLTKKYLNSDPMDSLNFLGGLGLKFNDLNSKNQTFLSFEQVSNEYADSSEMTNFICIKK